MGIQTVAAVIGRPHGEPPFPIRADSFKKFQHIIPERYKATIRTIYVVGADTIRPLDEFFCFVKKVLV